MSQSHEIDLNLHRKQGEALNAVGTEILYGGAAGGGKSHLMRVAAIIWCSAIPGLQVYIFRRIREDLVKNHVEGPSGFRSLLAGWALSGFVKIVEDEIRFWNGSKIYLCHCKDEKDRFKYQGAEIHVLLIDELTHFTETIYRFLRGRVRAVGLGNIPEQYKGKFPRILCGSNPGNVGHLFVKRMFIDMCGDGQPKKMTDAEGGMIRQYIPARLGDNPSMAANDPDYRKRLRGLGSEALVKAMEDGDWDIIDGAYFDCWSTEKHVIQPFSIPKSWIKFRSGDWGSAKPFSFGWWAIVEDWYKTPCGSWLPRGSIIRYREWYGTKKDDSGVSVPNKGLKLTAEEVGKGIQDRTTEQVSYGVLDPAAFAEDGGPSIHERIVKGSNSKAIFRPADNSRVSKRGAMGGWDQMRARLKGDDFGEPYGDRPMIYCFSTCSDSIRTIPALQHDEIRPEDINTDSEDHAADEWRYACMSRPWAPSEPEQEEDKHDSYYTEEDEDDSWLTA